MNNLTSALKMFAPYLAGFGMPLLDSPVAPDGVTRPMPPDVQYPVLFIEVPAGQGDLLTGADGVDPTDDGQTPAPPGGEARRLLSMMRGAGVITAWHAFAGQNGVVACHVQLDRAQAEAWYSMLDYSGKELMSTSDEGVIPDPFKGPEGDIIHRFA